MPKPSRTEEMIPLGADFIPGPRHVICAKGQAPKEHEGNRMLRSMIRSKLQEYADCKEKLDRSYIVSQIINTVRRGGGFVRKVNGQWFDIGE